MLGIGEDIRFALRRLRQQPGFTAVAVMALALGLGANTAIFTLINSVMLQPLPVTRPHELLRLGDTNNCCVNSGLQTNYSLFSYDMLATFREELTEFTDLAGFQANVTATGIRAAEGGAARSLGAAYVTANYFRMFGVQPALGRLLQPGDDDPGAAPVFVMSHQAWRDQFGADPEAVGRTFYVNGTPLTLIGVAVPEFFGEAVRPNPAALWLPIGQERTIRGANSLVGRPETDWLYAIGRVRTGTPASAVGAHATQVLQSWLQGQTFLRDDNRADIPEQRVTVTSAEAGVQLMRARYGQPLLLLLGMSGLVLLITAANLANLLLARADRGQAAIRSALGAGVGRLIRQSMVEGIVLAVAGALVSLFVAAAATQVILATAFPASPLQAFSVTPSVLVMLFSLGLALATGLLFSAAPAWAMARTAPIEALRGSGRNGRDVAFMPRRSLVVVQVTLSLVLLVGAGVLTKSLLRIQSQPLGFDTDGRVVVQVDPPQLAEEPERLAALYDRMRERLRQVPGVTALSYALYSPMEGNNWSSGVTIAGRPPDPESNDTSSWNRVGPDFFETVGTQVVRGRGILPSDTPTSARVAVVNEAFVRRFFPSSEALGRQLGFGGAEHADDYQIVGIVEDVKYTGANAPPRPMVFFPVMQLVEHGSAGWRQTQGRSTLVRSLVLRVAPGTANLEPGVRRALADVHPDLIVTRILPLVDQVNANFRNDRLLAGLTVAYGGLALALAAIGLYGVTAYGVARQRQEIGIRMALGAGSRSILWMVVRGALVQTSVGLVLGAIAALALVGVLSSLLFEVNARDPWVLAAAAGALLMTSVAAALWPARQAAALDPTRALRAQ
jgi:predicted permease